MSVDKAKVAIETGLRRMETSKEHLDKSNSDIDEAGRFIAHIWARLEGLQVALLRFDAERQPHLIGPRISQAGEEIEPIVSGTFSVLKENRQKRGMVGFAEKLRGGLADHAEEVTDLILTLGALHDGIGPLLEQAKSTTERCAAAAENGAVLSQYQNKIITGLEEYTL